MHNDNSMMKIESESRSRSDCGVVFPVRCSGTDGRQSVPVQSLRKDVPSATDAESTRQVPQRHQAIPVHSVWQGL